MNAVFGSEGFHARFVRADLPMREEGFVPESLHPRSEQNDMPGRSAGVQPADDPEYLQLWQLSHSPSILCADTRTLGYPVRFAGRLETAARDARWERSLASGDVIRLPDGDPHARLRGLHRIRNLVRDGGLVYITADGPFGREAFRIELQGGPLIVRAGWLALRRFTRVPTLPVFTYREGTGRVIVIHPPLPDPDGDAVRDADACRAALTPLVEAYVRRFPTQCRWVAMPRWPPAP